MSPTFIISQNQNPAIPTEIYEYGSTVETTEDTVVVLSSETSVQNGVYIGGSSGMLLDNTVIVCVSSSSEFAVSIYWRVFTDGNTVTNSVSLSPGSCMRFFPSTVLIANGGYFNPWLSGSIYMDTEIIDVRELVGDYECPTIVYFNPESETKQQPSYQGRNDYRFDKMTNVGRNFFGTRKNTTYQLNSGFILNDQPIEAKVLQVAAPDQIFDKEFIRVRVGCDVRPTVLRFYDSIADYDNGNPSATLLGSDMLDTNGFEQFFPLKNDKHFQGRRIFIEIVHILADENGISIADAEVTYTKIHGNGK